MKALLIEDDPKIQEIISVYLKARWPKLEVISTFEGKKGIELSESRKPDIIILDLNLPDMDGLEVLREVRSFSLVPIIILTVRGEEEDIIEGLELGADDYMVKPFRPAELLARIQAVLRRALLPELKSKPPLNLGELIIDPGKREVVLKGKDIKLSPTEYNLLYLLARNEGRVLTHELLLKKGVGGGMP
jgi:DNA-binding response OmpR family regulator